MSCPPNLRIKQRVREHGNKYRAMPELSLNGSYQLNGLGLSYTDAWSQVRRR